MSVFKGLFPVAAFSAAVVVPIAGSAEERRLSELLPDPPRKVCEVTEGPLFFQPENLYEHINGAAEAFIEYDFRRLIHQVYGCDGMEIAVDLYEMETTLDAFGIYSSERGRDSEFLKIGLEGYQEGEVLNFVRDRYYVKLTAYAENGADDTVVSEFARKIDERLPAGTSFPETLSLFPAEGSLPHSQSYVKTAPLGHLFLSPGYLTEYRIEEKATTLLVSPSSDGKEAAGKLDQLRDQMMKRGEVAEVDGIGQGAFLAFTRYEGEILALQCGRFVVVLVEPPKNYGLFLDTLVSRLEEEGGSYPSER
jgi:hypothetical protein